MKTANSKLTIIFFLISTLLLLFSCDTTDPSSNKTLTLEFEEASCTEAWLNLKTENISLPTEIEIQCFDKLSNHDSTFLSTSINTNDTILFIENLQPSSDYIFTAKTNGIRSSNSTLRTMDTTSHNFTWETFTFGNYNSVLRDVAVINENNIWAVGEIHTEDTDKFDSNGVWIKSYNAVHWDGNTWELKRINGDSSPMYTVYAFSEDDIWFSGFIHWDGIRYSVHIKDFPLLLNGDGWRIYSMWGISSKDFYVVGYSGNIAHYNGSSWTKTESGTEEDLLEIYGDENSIYVAGGTYMNESGVLLKGGLGGFDVIKEGSWAYIDTVFNPYFAGSLSALWLTPKGTLYFAGQALYKNKDNNWDFDRTLEGNYLRGNGGGKYYSSITSIRGNADNDLVLVGLTNTVRHFNGVSWKQLGEEYDPNLSILLWWYSVSMNNNEIIAVGEKSSQAIIRRFIR